MSSSACSEHLPPPLALSPEAHAACPFLGVTSTPSELVRGESPCPARALAAASSRRLIVVPPAFRMLLDFLMLLGDDASGERKQGDSCLLCGVLAAVRSVTAGILPLMSE